MHVYVHMRAHYQDVYMKRNDGGRSCKAAHNAAFLSGGGSRMQFFDFRSFEVSPQTDQNQKVPRLPLPPRRALLGGRHRGAAKRAKISANAALVAQQLEGNTKSPPFFFFTMSTSEWLCGHNL